MLKNLSIKILFTLFSLLTFSQDPVKWSTSVKKINDITFQLNTKAEIEDNWRLYSQNLDDGGALPTEFIFEDNSILKSFSNVLEPEPITKYDPIFKMDQSYFVNNVVFTQNIVLLENFNNDSIIQNLYYQVCDDRVCIFQDVQLVFNLSSNQLQSVNSFDYSSIESDLKLDLGNYELIKNEYVSENSSSFSRRLNILILGLLGGFLALLTPCVFPMIPLTVSFFSTKNEKAKLYSTSYGLFIILIYISLSLPFYFLENINPEILNQISTSPILNFIFFAIFIAFALSLFGLFDITLPSSWSNTVDSKSNLYKGLISTFFMSLTLCLVSFSCTGPILGTLLVGTLSSDGGAIDLTYGMLGFGVALAIPFTLLAFFPNIINKLPKSGSWTNTIKVILGFVELALAFKFLSNVDLVQEWGILKREVFIAIWVLIFIACGLYLIITSRKTSYIISSLSFILIGLYMGSSLFTKSTNLSLLSGLLPPEFYSIHNDTNNCPLGLDCVKDFNDGLNKSKINNKPILLDFTGWACANCRRVEENTWSVPKVFDLINNEFVLISLYVDDRTNLNGDEIILLRDKNGNEKILDKVGEKWSAFQTLNFQNNSQPYYVLLSPNLDILNKPIQYTDTDTYYDWLIDGLNKFKN
ncbi:MAG: cytochrome c biogenesis protein CcdA [Flavobacteriaceae bacterium]